jgi:hypothetical protein
MIYRWIMRKRREEGAVVSRDAVLLRMRALYVAELVRRAMDEGAVPRSAIVDGEIERIQLRAENEQRDDNVAVEGMAEPDARALAVRAIQGDPRYAPLLTDETDEKDRPYQCGYGVGLLKDPEFQLDDDDEAEFEG